MKRYMNYFLMIAASLMLASNAYAIDPPSFQGTILANATGEFLIQNAIPKNSRAFLQCRVEADRSVDKAKGEKGLDLSESLGMNFDENLFAFKVDDTGKYFFGTPFIKGTGNTVKIINLSGVSVNITCWASEYSG